MHVLSWTDLQLGLEGGDLLSGRRQLGLHVLPLQPQLLQPGLLGPAPYHAPLHTLQAGYKFLFSLKSNEVEHSSHVDDDQYTTFEAGMVAYILYMHL